MIYVKPRRRMNVDRMRRQREKHHDLRYQVWYISGEYMADLDQDAWLWVMNEHKEMFRQDVLKWNMWRKAPLSDITAYLDYDIEFFRHRLLFEIRRLREAPIKEFW